MISHTKHTLRQELLITVVAVGLVPLIGCGQEETTIEPIDTPVLTVEEETIVDEAVDQMTLPIEVRLALLDEFGVDGLRIETAVENGYVTLAGIVHDPATQLRAETIVTEIDGVDEVYNTIAVAPFEERGPEAETSEELKLELADELLEAEIALRIFAAIGGDAGRLEVEAVHGTITLSGLVGNENNKTEAIAAAEGALGTVEVVDFVEVSDPIIVEEEH